MGTSIVKRLLSCYSLFAKDCREMTNPNQGDTGERGKELHARRGYLTVDDPALHEATSSPWEIMTTQIDRGALGHWKDYLLTPSLIIYREGFAAAVRLRGLSPEGIIGFCLPLQLGGSSSLVNYLSTPFAGVPRINRLNDGH